MHLKKIILVYLCKFSHKFLRLQYLQRLEAEQFFCILIGLFKLSLLYIFCSIFIGSRTFYFKTKMFVFNIRLKTFRISECIETCIRLFFEVSFRSILLFLSARLQGCSVHLLLLLYIDPISNCRYYGLVFSFWIVLSIIPSVCMQW
jgi:hypothetical protein